MALGSGRRNTINTTNANTTTEGQLRSRRKAAKMLVAVVVMFAVCYFPVHLLNILRGSGASAGVLGVDLNVPISILLGNLNEKKTIWVIKDCETMPVHRSAVQCSALTPQEQSLVPVSVRFILPTDPSPLFCALLTSVSDEI
uniref:(California timema) hypothetical protein n=1 Tax=Timema californicum TaxID=61474 RepID=A0A7R9J758_TIMCA|nr:unnamed protein product [Timema californicum]